MKIRNQTGKSPIYVSIHIYISIYIYIYVSMGVSEWMGGCMHGWMDALSDGWMDGWMDGCIVYKKNDKQIHGFLNFMAVYTCFCCMSFLKR